MEALGFRPEGSPPISLQVAGPGRPGESVAVPAGVFRISLSLSPGESVITLGGRSVKVFVTGPGAQAPEAFSPPDPHAVDNGCEECHAAARDAMPLNAAMPQLCENCHDPIGKGKDGEPNAVTHPPVDEGDCRACHAFHGRSLRRLPPAAKREICLACHDDPTGGGKLRLHAPVAKGECNGCHLPHGSPEAKLLPAHGLKLCLLCHKNPAANAEGQEWGTPHAALDDGCPSCHLPHASAARGLLTKGQGELCADCHDGIVPPEGAPGTVHPPVADGECAGCHNPHGADAGKLLRAGGEALCELCHDDPAKAPGGEEWATPHPALDDGCPSCHLPHASPQQSLLKRAQAPLCFGCHDPFPAVAAGGEALRVHLPVAKGECAGCHAPHGSGTPKLLVKAAPELCLRCHADPTRTAEGGEWAVPHPALDDGCLACHRPHVSVGAKMLEKAQAELCAGCHEDKNHDSDGNSWYSEHRPVAAGVCGECHGPHGAPQPALLKRLPPELCTASCHQAVHPNHQVVELDAFGQVTSRGVTLPEGFPVRKKDGALLCSGCHLPHGSVNPRLWNRTEAEFCPQCHRQY